MRKGFSLVELVVAIGIFIFLAAGVTFLATGSYTSFTGSGNTREAERFAKQALEVLQIIQERSWSVIDQYDSGGDPSPDLLGNDGFDTDTVGGEPTTTGWTAIGTNAWVISNDCDLDTQTDEGDCGNSTNRAVKMSSASSYDLYKGFTEQSSGSTCMRFRIKVPSTNQSHYGFGMNDNAVARFACAFRYTGKVSCWNAGVESDTGYVYSANTWYQVAITVNEDGSPNKLYTTYLDTEGNLDASDAIATNYAFDANGVVNRVLFTPFGGSSDNAFLDEVSVTSGACTFGGGASSVRIDKNASGDWTLASGTEVRGSFTRSIYISPVERDVSGNIVASGGTDDPSTKKVVITISATGRADYTLESYLINWDAYRMTQTSWSGATSTSLWSGDWTNWEHQSNIDVPTSSGKLELATTTI